MAILFYVLKYAYMYLWRLFWLLAIHAVPSLNTDQLAIPDILHPLQIKLVHLQ